MINPARIAGRWVLKRLGLHSAVALRMSGALQQDGWFRSFEEKRPVDAHGRPLPWLTYPTLELLSRRMRSDMTVFEFGSGWGTLWWASRAVRVVACEHDLDWYRAMSTRVPENVTLIHVDLAPDGDYCRAAARRGERFDVVIVDGRDRIHCAIRSIPALKEGGVLIWDNTDRERYRDGIQDLRHRGFKQLELVGLVPGSPAKVETSIFYRPMNCFDL